jgi:hypothetical protein
VRLGGIVFSDVRILKLFIQVKLKTWWLRMNVKTKCCCWM